METNSSGLVGLLLQKMGYLNQRQSVLAENVANADTPGYQARDLAPFSFGNALRQANIGMTTTDAHHIVPASMAGVNSKSAKNKGYDTTLTGNSVDVEHEMMEVSKTAVEYKEVTSLYHKIGGLFKIALKGSSS